MSSPGASANPETTDDTIMIQDCVTLVKKTCLAYHMNTTKNNTANRTAKVFVLKQQRVLLIERTKEGRNYHRIHELLNVCKNVSCLKTNQGQLPLPAAHGNLLLAFRALFEPHLLRKRDE